MSSQDQINPWGEPAEKWDQVVITRFHSTSSTSDGVILFRSRGEKERSSTGCYEMVRGVSDQSEDNWAFPGQTFVVHLCFPQSRWEGGLELVRAKNMTTSKNVMHSNDRIKGQLAGKRGRGTLVP